MLRIETDRLGELLERSTAFYARRVDRLTFASGSRYHWDVTNEITIPTLNEDTARTREPQPRVVSLGVYEKIPYPDLVVMDASGDQLPVLGRKERALLLGDLFLRGHVPKASPRNDARLRAIKSLVNLVIFSPRTLATQLADDLRAYLRDWDYALTHPDLFSKGLDKLVGSRHVLAVVVARPGETVVVRHSYSQEFRWDERDPFGHGRLVNSLGMLPRRIFLRYLNISQPSSYHLIVEAPEGLCVEDAGWTVSEDAAAFHRELPKGAFLRGTTVTLSSYQRDPVVCTHLANEPTYSTHLRAAHIARRFLRKAGSPVGKALLGISPRPEVAPAKPEPSVAQFGVQIHPRGVVRFAAAVLAALLGAFATVVWQIDKLPRVESDAAGAALVAVPALGGLALSQLVSRATARLVSSLRWMLIFGSLVAFICAGLIAFHISAKWIVLNAAIGAGFSLAGLSGLLWSAFSTRKPTDSLTLSDLTKWRREREHEAHRHLQTWSGLSAGLFVGLLILGLHRAG
ncbi:MAG: hypothetical protein ACT4PI_16905 [Actinomycetota bacterium]